MLKFVLEMSPSGLKVLPLILQVRGFLRDSVINFPTALQASNLFFTLRHWGGVALASLSSQIIKKIESKGRGTNCIEVFA